MRRVRVARIIVDADTVIDRMRKLAIDMAEINEMDRSFLCDVAADVMIAQAEEIEALKAQQ